MALSRSKNNSSMNYWPGFIDAMACMLLLFIFLLSVFMLVQFLLIRDVSSQGDAISELEQKISQLGQFLALEKSEKAEIAGKVTKLQKDLQQKEQAKLFLKSTLELQQESEKKQAEFIVKLKEQISQKDTKTDLAIEQILLLNQQISALRSQIAVLESVLQASEKRDKQSQVQITNLAKRLNAALARKVQLLSRYRSDFFGRLRSVLKQSDDIRIEGDRFVFQSELFFSSGSAYVSIDALSRLRNIAKLLLEFENIIPPDIKWVLRIDGHTDSRPINNYRFRSNWELSAQRAIAVAQALIDNGVSPKRLLAAGFGEFQPIVDEYNEQAYGRNRRIEFKLTER